MIDIATETLRSMVDAAKALPGRPHVSTVYRWWRYGVKGVKLETVAIGGRRFTSVEALQRFAEQLGDNPGPQNFATSASRRRAAELADRKLTSLKI